MDVNLIRTSGQQRTIKVESFAQARQMVCDFDPNGNVLALALSDGRSMLMDEAGNAKGFAANKAATDIVSKFSTHPIQGDIVGDVIVISATFEFDQLPYEHETESFIS